MQKGLLESSISLSKQAYNDVLDFRLLDFLSIEINSMITIRKYLQTVNKKIPDIVKICTHPKENQDERLIGLTNGLIKLGIGQPVEVNNHQKH